MKFSALFCPTKSNFPNFPDFTGFFINFHLNFRIFLSFFNIWLLTFCGPILHTSCLHKRHICLTNLPNQDGGRWLRLCRLNPPAVRPGRAEASAPTHPSLPCHTTIPRGFSSLSSHRRSHRPLLGVLKNAPQNPFKFCSLF